ncbi:MAG: hypothetical protein AAFU67_01055 [Bacteroidota bacterium]
MTTVYYIDSEEESKSLIYFDVETVEKEVLIHAPIELKGEMQVPVVCCE